MNIIIRHAKIEDAHEIAEAEREIAKEQGFFCSQPSEISDENVVNTIAAFLKDKTGVYFVAEYEGKLVGHVFLEPFLVKSLRHVADLNIAVHSGWQKKGIGTKLLQSTIEWAGNSGSIEKIQLNVRASNSAAIALYKKMGFEEEGRLKNRVKVNGHYIDDIIMGLDLSKNSKDVAARPQAIMDDFQPINILPASKCEAEKACREITCSLPEYFGIQEANERYVNGVKERHTFGAKLKGIYVGLISCEIPFPNNGNIYWMAVRKDYHGQGIGQALLKYAEAYCSKLQCASITVETLSPAEKDPNYIKTYAFYQRNGFEPLFELNTYGPDFKMVYLYKKLEKKA